MLTLWDVILNIKNSISEIRKKQFIFLVILSITTAIIEILNLSVLDILIKKLLNQESLEGTVNSNSFNLLDKIFALPPKNVLLVLIIFLLLGLTFRLITISLQYKYTAFIGADLARRSFYSIINMPYQWHTSKNSSEAITILTKDADQFTIFVQECLSLLVNSSLVLIVSAWMIQYSFSYFSTIILIFTIILFSIYQYNKIPLRKQGSIHTKTNQSSIKIVQETLGSIREIFIKNSFKVHFDEFNSNYLKYRISTSRIATRVQAPRTIVETIVIIIIAIIFVIFNSSKARYIDFTITGTLLFGILKLLSPLQICFTNLNNLYAVQPSVLKIVNALKNYNNDTKKKENNFNNFKRHPPLEEFKKLTLKDVNFKYEGSRNMLLKNISLSISKGDKIGIIGRTGSGKSTLIDIILGLLIPTSGQLTLDGKNIFSEECLRESWTYSLSCVSQNIFLRDVSIAENIAYGLNINEIDMNRVKKVSKLACIDSFIDKLPNGYKTRVGERGLLLSGGQRQRLAIASALYSESKILIFDEATSALDINTEKKVMKAIENEEILQTYIFITHRLNTLSSCNKIFLLKDGSISKPLTFEEIKNSTLFDDPSS